VGFPVLHRDFGLYFQFNQLHNFIKAKEASVLFIILSIMVVYLWYRFSHEWACYIVRRLFSYYKEDIELLTSHIQSSYQNSTSSFVFIVFPFNTSFFHSIVSVHTAKHWAFISALAFAISSFIISGEYIFQKGKTINTFFHSLHAFIKARYCA